MRTNATYDRMTVPDGVKTTVSSEGNEVTIAVGSTQRINCDVDTAHGVLRDLIATLYGGDLPRPKWVDEQPDVTRSARTGKSWPVGVCVIAVPHKEPTR